MRVLIDTHALLWAVIGDRRLSKKAQDTMESFETEAFVSAASAWEICTKHRLGKLPEAEDLVGNLGSILGQLGFRELAVSLKHAERAGILPGAHRDPFDRMLIAQAQTENLSIVSNDRFFDEYAVTRIW